MLERIRAREGVVNLVMVYAQRQNCSRVAWNARDMCDHHIVQELCATLMSPPIGGFLARRQPSSEEAPLRAPICKLLRLVLFNAPLLKRELPDSSIVVHPS